MKKTIITAERWEQIEKDAETSKVFLESKDFAFLRDYFYNASQEIEEIILNNRVRDVREELTISEKLKKIFFTKKQEQLDELAGQYKFIQGFFEFLDKKSKAVTEAEAMQKKGAVIIESSNEEVR